MMATSTLVHTASRVSLGETSDFELGGLQVRPAHREVCMNGNRRDLEPRVMKVLVALAEARPSVVSRDKLVEICWEGRIVGDDALNRCVVALRRLARQFAPLPFTIQTVPRVGYCLVEQPASENDQAYKRKRWLTAGAVALLLAVVAVAFGTWVSRGLADEAPTSIAVLPFRSLSVADTHLAEGVGEEILNQLAREPHFRVAGSASSGQLARAADFREVASRLDVDYVLEGSVRTQSGRIRVNAHLVRASDGNRFWSESYDGSLDDIFAIQQRIGASIASALSGRLIRSPSLVGPLVTTGEAYNLYLTARGLIRTNDRRVGGTAANLLRDAINIDPTYAPAWAVLATAVRLDGATKGHQGFILATEQAQAHASHALRLAPELADAHRILGMIYGYGTPQANFHLQRAVRIDPHSAENWIWAGVAYGAAGEFGQERAAYNRAVELDPLWFHSIKHAAVAVAEMGDRAGAEAIVRRGHPNDEISRNLAFGRIAWIFGDFSEAARRWSLVARSDSPRWSNLGRRNLNDATYAVGIRSGPLVAVPPPNDQRRTTPIWMNRLPTAPEWLERNGSRIAGDVYRDENHKAAKLMLRVGRAREVIVPYSGIGLFGLRSGQALRSDQLHEAPVIILALRASGRAAEADRLIAQANALIRNTYRRGDAPFWFDADTAAIWAIQGRRDAAMSMIERAMTRGWTHTGHTDLGDIGEEPAFAALLGNPRFERIRARLSSHLARERRETAALGI